MQGDVSRGTQSNVQSNAQSNNNSDECLTQLLEKYRGFCPMCLAKSQRNKHILSSCPLMRGICLRCMGHCGARRHSARDCTAKAEWIPGQCMRCYLPQRIGRDHDGVNCANGFVRDYAVAIYTGNTSFGEYWEWLCRVEQVENEQGYTNCLRVFLENMEE